MKIFFLSILTISTLFIGCKNKVEPIQTIADTTEKPTDTIQLDKNADNWTKNAVIYEVNVRQFSPEGNLAAVTQQISRLDSMGVDVLWLMPIYPIGQKNRKGSMGSYYAVKDYTAVNPEFGSLDDLKILVNTAHENGIKVILDWVANHSSPDNVWVKEHLDYYTKDSLGNAPIPTVGTDWTDVADLNYDNPEMRTAMQNAMKFWLTEADVDGFRCDVAEMVPTDFWVETKTQLDSIKPTFMLAEGAKPELFEAFDMIYGWPLKDSLVAIADGKKDFSAIENYLIEKLSDEDKSGITMYFTTNHDENSWNYLEKEKFGKNRLNYVALTIALNGMPLVYSGQESGLDKQLAFFKKDTIEWKNYPYQDFYTRLFNVYKTNPVFWNNTPAKYEFLRTDKDGLEFIMDKDGDLVAFLQNYSDKPHYVSKIALNGLDTTKDLLSNTTVESTEKGIEIPPHSTLIFGH